MNGHACCILSVCCDRKSQKRIDALADEMVKGGLAEKVNAQRISAWIVETFDLLPAGSIDLTGVAHAIREHDKKA